MAIELLAAAQALDLRSPLIPGAGSRAGRAALREVVSFLEEDQIGPDIHAAAELVRDGALLDAVAEAVSLR